MVEKKDPKLHSALGVIDDFDSLVAPQDIGLPAVPRKAPNYCDDCGFVDDHADGCPQLQAEMLIQQERREIALEQAEAASQEQDVLPLLRKIGATLLRKIAKRLDPGGK